MFMTPNITPYFLRAYLDTDRGVHYTSALPTPSQQMRCEGKILMVPQVNHDFRIVADELVRLIEQTCGDNLPERLRFDATGLTDNYDHHDTGGNAAVVVDRIVNAFAGRMTIEATLPLKSRIN